MSNKILVYTFVFIFSSIFSGLVSWGLSFILERSYFRENLIILSLSVGLFATFGPIIADYFKKFFKIRNR